MTGTDLTSPADAAARELERTVAPDRVLRAGPAYEQARMLWNGAVTARPALVVQVETPTEVQAAVTTARQHGLRLAVRGGGHDWAGRALVDGGLVIDLSRLRRVRVDVAARTAAVAGGATAADLLAATAPHGLATATGSTGAVGWAGLALGGGYGPLNGRCGLALDNILSAEVVLADGTLVAADSERHSTLFWALRGGGGNFGVVTGLRVRLHPIDQVLTGMITFDQAAAPEVFGGLAEVVANAPDALTVSAGFITAPDGTPAVFAAPTWSGDLAEGEAVVAGLRRLGTPTMWQVATMPYQNLLSLFDAAVPPGRHYEVRTRTVPGYRPEVIDVLVEAGRHRSSPLSGVVVHHFHGHSTRVAPEATAFGYRQPHLMVEAIAVWEPDDPAADSHRAWATGVAASLAPAALPGGYPNVLGPDETARAADAYGPNADRLRAAKRRFDPENVFTAIPLPPA